MNLSCPNCKNPTNTINDDGVCPRCEVGRVSSPPPPAPTTNVAKTAGKSFHTGKLTREPISAKIPLQRFLADQRLSAELPPVLAVPEEAAS